MGLADAWVCQENMLHELRMIKRKYGEDKPFKFVKMDASCFSCKHCRNKNNELKCKNIFSGIKIIDHNFPVCNHYSPIKECMKTWIKISQED